MAKKAAQAILLVDAYNIVGAWRELVELKDNRGLDAAREALIAALANYSAYQEFETWAVFDAYEQRTPASQESITRHLSVHYTGYGQTADSYIERACAKFRNDSRKFTQRLIVATSDNVHRQTVVGYGAEGISALQLQNEVISISKKVQQRQKAKKNRSGRVFAALNPDVQAQLTRMRLGQ
ncbi:MAG: NYN domain-containing protein [Cyanobacteria bacterium P01_D01_bin.36]